MYPTTVAFALSSGALCGFLARNVKGPSVARSFSGDSITAPAVNVDQAVADSIFWFVPEDFRKTEDLMRKETSV
eukprot:766154-Hanusia_phi.AAC.5